MKGTTVLIALSTAIIGAVIMDYVNYSFAKHHDNAKWGGIFEHRK